VSQIRDSSNLEGPAPVLTLTRNKGHPSCRLLRCVVIRRRYWNQSLRRNDNTKLFCTFSMDLMVNAEVEVTLRPTVSRPVRLGVLPLLEQVTGCYIYLSDNYFLYFSCKAPTLTKGQVCNLQCNDSSSISSYIATDGLSASSSWCRQILISLFDSYFVFSV
jgi:hypothetical protein